MSGFVCRSCSNIFVQSELCAECGSKKLYGAEIEAAWAENRRLRYALEIIAGLKQPADNLLSNADVARVALRELE